MSMQSALEHVSNDIRFAVQRDLLCVADTKLVLGNWFAECVMNGRSLPDFAAMLGMCTASYGQTRALYQYLDSLDYSYPHLERGRSADEIASMLLIDEPPADWEDFLVTIWLAEQATWAMMSGFLNHPDRTIAGLARKVGEESYFHLKYVSGWFAVIQNSPRQVNRVLDSVAERLPLALEWFGNDPADPLFTGGMRDSSLRDIRDGFLSEVTQGLQRFGFDVRGLREVSSPFPWRPEVRRRGPLPEGLFEIIRFKDPELAR